MNFFRASSWLRSACVALAALAWLVGSNHCALRLLASGTAAETAHHCCQGGGGTEQAPVKEDGTICCRALHAVMTDGGKALDLAPPNLIGPCDWMVAEAVANSGVEAWWRGEATGPPKGASFSELVLGRSLQAHAPPVAG